MPYSRFPKDIAEKLKSSIDMKISAMMKINMHILKFEVLKLWNTINSKMYRQNCHTTVNFFDF